MSAAPTRRSSCSASPTSAREARDRLEQPARGPARRMRERSRVFALTGDDLVRVELEGSQSSDPESLLRGVAARSVAVDPRDPDRVYVGTLDSGVYVSNNGGVSWRNDEDGLADRRVLAVAVSPSDQTSGRSVAYAGTEPSN